MIIQKEKTELEQCESEVYLSECSETKECVEDRLIYIRDQVELLCNNIHVLEETANK